MNCVLDDLGLAYWKLTLLDFSTCSTGNCVYAKKKTKPNKKTRMDRVDDPLIWSSLVRCLEKCPATNTKERMSEHGRCSGVLH